MNTVRLTLELETSFLDVVDRARGEVNRSDYLANALKELLAFMDEHRRTKFPPPTIWWGRTRGVALKIHPDTAALAAEMLKAERAKSMTDLVRMAGIRAAAKGGS